MTAIGVRIWVSKTVRSGFSAGGEAVCSLGLQRSFLDEKKIAFAFQTYGCDMLGWKRKHPATHLILELSGIQ